MAGHMYIDDPLNDDNSLFNAVSFLEDLILPNNNSDKPSSPSPTTPSKTTRHRDAHITPPPVPLELRQNNPQDCSNLIIASVNRAAVEISRTIIALNATFSQQLQQASISASNGIKSAQDSASSTVSVVSQNASIATSSAFSMVTVANLVATSASVALTSVQSSASTAMMSANMSIVAATSSLTLARLALTSVMTASSTDVSRLSSSVAALQASVASVQSSASAAIAAAQLALVSATGSAAAQASSILASAARQTISAGSSNQPLPAFQVPQTISLTPGQAAGIVVGAVATSILLTFAVYFLVIRMKKSKERDSYLSEKDIAESPKKLPSRFSSTFRTGNSMTIKFNPPKASDAPTPSRSALRRPEDFPVTSSYDAKANPAREVMPDVIDESRISLVPAAWPLASSNTSERNISGQGPPPARLSAWPLTLDIFQDITATPTALSTRNSITESVTPVIPNAVKSTATGPPLASALDTSLDLVEEKPIAATDTSPDAYDLDEQAVVDPFQDPIEEFVPIQVMDDLRSEEPIINPFEDPISDSIPYQPIDDQTTEPTSIEGYIEVSAPVNEDTNNFQPETQEQASSILPNESINKSPSAEDLEEPVQSPSEATNEHRLEHLSLEKLLPEQTTRVPAPEILDLLKNDQEPRNSTVPEIDTLLLKVAEQNGAIGNKPLFWSDFRAPDVEVERAMSPPLVREQSFVDATLSPTHDTIHVEAMTEPEENILSPLFQTSNVEGPTVGTDIPSPLPQNTPMAEQEPSPHRPPSSYQVESSHPLQDPRTQSEGRWLAGEDLSSNSQTPENKSRVDDREERGRSMIRTSDIIEARLSRLVVSEKEKPVEETTKARAERMESPLRRNPVNLVMPPEEQRNRTISPLRRNPFNAPTENRKSRTLSPLRRNPLQPIPSTAISREESPLRRNPTVSRPPSNANFSQTLSKFQNLTSQNPNDVLTASNEVTQRAMKGIYIPGSLREYAVRNLSKSRERGKSVVGDKDTQI